MKNFYFTCVEKLFHDITFFFRCTCTVSVYMNMYCKYVLCAFLSISQQKNNKRWHYLCLTSTDWVNKLTWKELRVKEGGATPTYYINQWHFKGFKPSAGSCPANFVLVRCFRPPKQTSKNLFWQDFVWNCYPFHLKYVRPFRMLS